ncbi:MAG: helix-turn-helix domain-containing protein [Clostridiales bacterium]|nr:helix-turn-helix domain-containing protein [Clostridiales bacterium]MDR2749065.1 helix-turn-helix domain-containing protein [Clostridiales bacterium]
MSYKCISDYLEHIISKYNVQVCVKDFCGFVPINKSLDEALRPYLAHTNPFCMYIKHSQRYHICLSMMKGMRDKLEKEGEFFGMCHAGLSEHVLPIKCDGMLLGAICVGFFQSNEVKTERRIAKAFQKDKEDAAKASELYKDNIKNVDTDVEELLIVVRMLAEYLGNTYWTLKNAQPEDARLSNARYISSSEDTIIVHATEYIQQNYDSRIKVSEIADFCHCSESYLSHLFKKRTGVNLNAYINKVRIEFAKTYLMHTDSSVTVIASMAGFEDANYFSRIFSELIGYPPTEFRRRHLEAGPRMGQIDKPTHYPRGPKM